MHFLPQPSSWTSSSLLSQRVILSTPANHRRRRSSTCHSATTGSWSITSCLSCMMGSREKWAIRFCAVSSCLNMSAGSRNTRSCVVTWLFIYTSLHRTKSRQTEHHTTDRLVQQNLAHMHKSYPQWGTTEHYPTPPTYWTPHSTNQHHPLSQHNRALANTTCLLNTTIEH